MSEKEYKYKLEVKDDFTAAGIKRTDADRANQNIFKKGRIGLWKPTIKVNSKYKITSHTAVHWGEFIGSLLYRQSGFPTCDVEVLKRRMVNPRSTRKTAYEIPGCISYFDLAQGEIFIPAIDIMAWYKEEHYEDYTKIMDPLGECPSGDFTLDKNNMNNNNNIELIIPAFQAYVKERMGATDKQAQALTELIIGMVVRDCKFSNVDRNDENYGLALSKKAFRFYPLFDNERILGFQTSEEDIEKFSGARLQEYIDQDLTSRMGITSKPTKLGYKAMMTYLYTAYPKETKQAYEETSKVVVDDLQAIMEECEELSDVHKELATRIFKMRTRELEAIDEIYYDSKGRLISSSLPGNKPMEVKLRKKAAVSSKETKFSGPKVETVLKPKDERIK